MKPEIVCWWIRRDLRLNDNAALFHALKSGLPVLPLFIFDRLILDKLAKPYDARVQFIHHHLELMKSELEGNDSSLEVRYGFPEQEWKKLFEAYHIKAIYTNRDYEPYATERDATIAELAQEHGAGYYLFKDQVVFEKDDILKSDGTPFVVYTPFSKAWKARMAVEPIPYYASEDLLSTLHKNPPLPMPSLESMGFSTGEITYPSMQVSVGLLKKYADTRDIPGMDGTSRLGVHYRFGTISPRQKAAAAEGISEKYFNELIWREFYMYILAHFPRVVGRAFRPEYDKIAWLNNEADFEKWKYGKTGIPMVDAGMRELLATGYMHNRTRMVVASFLTKNLLIDWRWGEAWFAEKLLDFELSSNNGGWQWAAGTGVDAAPYFRVFNPIMQQEKFDPNFAYIKKWVPEYGTPAYPKPMVDLKTSRERALATYQKALKG